MFKKNLPSHEYNSLTDILWICSRCSSAKTSEAIHLHTNTFHLETIRFPNAAARRCNGRHSLSNGFLFLLTFTGHLPRPVSAVVVHDTHHFAPDQRVFGRALQGNDGAHGGAVALDDPLGAQSWQPHRGALSLRDAWEGKVRAN